MDTLVLKKKFHTGRWIGGLKLSAFNLGLICLGNIIFTIGMNGILVPHGLLSGGTLGIALILHYFFPFFNIGWGYMLINVPLLWIGWRYVNSRFMMYTLFSVLFFSLIADRIQPGMFAIADPMLASIFAGIVCGVGSGVILRSVGSGGGLDVFGIYLNMKYGFPVGSTLFVANASVLVVGAFLYDLQILLYSMIFLFAYGKTIDVIILGLNKRKSLLVISGRSEQIAAAILAVNGIGVTYLQGEGAFSGEGKQVIYTIISLMELPKIKNLILRVDPDAFIVINETQEVIGSRYGNGRTYVK